MKRHCVKFSELSKTSKIYRIVNLCLTGAIFLLMVGLGIYNAVIGDPNNRVASAFMLAVVTILPLLVELIFRWRFSNTMYLLYLIYLLLAGLGSVLSIYKNIPYYDKIIHVLAGYTFALLGIYIFSLLEDYYKFKPITIAFMALCFTLGVALVWELMEWFSDVFMGMDAQGIPPEGFDVPLVTDTDGDMLCNLCGGLVFFAHYLISKYSKCSLGIKYYEKEFVFLKKNSVKFQENKFEHIENAKLEENVENFDKNDEKNQNLSENLENKQKKWE